MAPLTPEETGSTLDSPPGVILSSSKSPFKATKTASSEDEEGLTPLNAEFSSSSGPSSSIELKSAGKIGKKQRKKADHSYMNSDEDL